LIDAGGGDVNPYAAPQSSVDLARGQSPDAGGFRSVTPLARAITVVLALFTLFAILRAANSLVAVSVMGRVIAQESYERSEITAANQRARIVTVADFGLHLAAAVLFCLFMSRANRNVRAMGARRLRFTPGWAAGVLFVPIWNLWGPYQAMKELWQGSDPEWDLLSWEKAVPRSFPWWWGMYIFNGFAGGLVRGLHAHGTLSNLLKRANGPSELIDQSWGQVVDSGFRIAAAILAAVVVRQVAARQDERQRRLTAGAAP
jgi:hypothetical protein